jgi:hypothetical protein
MNSSIAAVTRCTGVGSGSPAVIQTACHGLSGSGGIPKQLRTAFSTWAAAPQVHHPLAVPPRGGRGPGSSLPGQDLSENLAHRLEPGLHVPTDVHPASVPQVTFRPSSNQHDLL